MIEEFLAKPVTKMPTQEEVEIMHLDLARLILKDSDEHDDNARDINWDGLANFENQQGQVGHFRSKPARSPTPTGDGIGANGTA